MTKIYAFYLPQFHRTPENDKWWGENFTEWTTVKKAKSLFPAHNQPHKPWKYYDLLDKSIMVEQAELMNEYGVDGLCFYHYYFEDGRKILERPAENLLGWKDIDMPFCFYWANESWIRTWSNMQDGNVWVSNLKVEQESEGDNVLLRQMYGGRKEWKAHFDYLLPFFKDDRYIKKEGRPIFIIYKPKDIERLAEMKDYWNELMEKEGLPHIYFLGRDTREGILDGVVEHEPQFMIHNLEVQIFENKYGIKQMIDYDDVWQRIIRNDRKGNDYYYGGFVGYDDTPRHGNRGTVITGQTPKKFRNYMICLLTKAYNADCDMVFLNAWNEWGEGMYLEPSAEYGYEYLKAIKEAKAFVSENKDILSDIVIENMRMGEKVADEKIERLVKKNERYRDYWMVLKDWLCLSAEGKSVTKYLKDKNIKKVAIYGMGMLGEILYKELRNNEFEVKYGIDRDCTKEGIFDIPIYTLKDDLQEVELIIVTVGYAFDSIKRDLLEKRRFHIMALREIVEYALK